MKILRADSWRRPHYTNGQWRNALEPRQRKGKCSVLKQLKTLKKIYPTTVCVAFIARYCPPGRSCNPWWNRGLADIDTTCHNEHPGVRLQIVLIGSWHPGAGTIVFSSSRPGLSHAFGGVPCLATGGGLWHWKSKSKVQVKYKSYWEHLSIDEERERVN